MPKDAIDLKLLINKIMKGEIQVDAPLITYLDRDGIRFPVFQDSALNLLLGNEGNGKTKFITECMIQILNQIKYSEGRLWNFKILYVDTERVEPQYAATIKIIYEKSNLFSIDLCERLDLLSVSELSPSDIKGAIDCHLEKYPSQKFIIIIDHILPFVNDMNNVPEADTVERTLKEYIFRGHLIIATIHKPSNGIIKGLGHLGSALQRLASFIIEISVSEDKSGYVLKLIKSRITSIDGRELMLRRDKNGNVDSSITPFITENHVNLKSSFKEETARELLQEFIKNGMTEKKQMMAFLVQKLNLKPKSSGRYTYYDNHMAKFITFCKGGYELTDAGKALINI
jgi:hypothetical protein